MLWRLAVLGLLLLAPALAGAQDLDALLAFIEEHNSRLQAQRQVRQALATAPPSNAEVLSVLEADRRSVWKHARLSAGLSERVSPGEEGSGLDARIGVTLTLPLADYGGRLALAREHQQQRDKQHTHAQQQHAAQLAYATLRAQLFAEVVAKLGAMEELATTLAAAPVQREARLAHRALMERRVAEGVESRQALWQLDEQRRESERQIPVQQAKLRQVKMEIALFGGEQWKTLLGWLDARNSWLPSSEK